MSELPGNPAPESEDRGELSDPKKVGRKGLMDRIKDRQAKEDALFVLSSIQGRRFYWKLMKRCGIFQTSFTGNNTTFFNEGMRNVGLELLKDVNELSPEAYLKMIQESKLEESKNK